VTSTNTQKGFLFGAKRRIETEGFTLVELLLTIALLSIAVGVTTDIILSITKSYSKTEMANELEQNANFVSLKLEKELRNASSVTVPATVDAPSSTLTFVTTDGLVVTYNLDASGLLNRNGSVIVNNDSTVGVLVSCPAGCFTLKNTSPQVVQMGLRFQQRNSGGNSSFTGVVDLNNTVVLRGTY
jgi:prepilin-type N-terminal cleavage/methylation domain-containing protein